MSECAGNEQTFGAAEIALADAGQALTERMQKVREHVDAYARAPLHGEDLGALAGFIRPVLTDLQFKRQAVAERKEAASPSQIVALTEDVLRLVEETVALSAAIDARVGDMAAKTSQLLLERHGDAVREAVAARVAEGASLEEQAVMIVDMRSPYVPMTVAEVFERVVLWVKPRTEVSTPIRRKAGATVSLLDQPAPHGAVIAVTLTWGRAIVGVHDLGRLTVAAIA
ncbi:MAG: hypothetical protein ACHREM_03870 [Polyangiales bacterium]